MYPNCQTSQNFPQNQLLKVTYLLILEYKYDLFHIYTINRKKGWEEGIRHQIKLNQKGTTVKPVLRDYLWAKENVVF